MSEQPEALRAADWIEKHAPILTLQAPMAAATDIRRLHAQCERMERLYRAARSFVGTYDKRMLAKFDETVNKWDETHPDRPMGPP